MEVYGNVEALKKAIEKKYHSMIQGIEKDKKKQLTDMLEEVRENLSLLKSHMKTQTDAEVKKTTSMTLSAAKLSAKKEFEEKREAIIESVFSKAAEKAKDIAHSKEYLDFVSGIAVCSLGHSSPIVTRVLEEKGIHPDDIFYDEF